MASLTAAAMLAKLELIPWAGPVLDLRLTACLVCPTICAVLVFSDEELTAAGIPCIEAIDMESSLLTSCKFTIEDFFLNEDLNIWAKLGEEEYCDSTPSLIGLIVDGLYFGKALMV